MQRGEGGEEFARAVQVRGLTLAELAKRARVSAPTVSSAVHQRPINVSSALRLCRALGETPVVAELDRWVGRSSHPRAAA